jgi:hypothetical protein
MTMLSWWRRQLRTADERTQFGLRAPDPSGVGRQATAEVSPVAQQTVRGVAFEVVPHLLDGIQFRRIRGELFHVQPGMGLAHRLDGRAPMNRAAIPEQDDGSPEMPQKRPQERGHIEGLEVVRLKADVQAQVLAFGRDRQGRQRRNPIVLVIVGEDRCVPHGRPGPATGRDEQKAALIQESEMGPKSSGFFLWPAMCSASSARWPARSVGWLAAPAPDSSTPSGVRASRRARDDSAPQSAPESPPRCAAGSTARWRTHGFGPPGATAAPTAYTARWSICTAARVLVGGPRPLRRPRPRPAATDKLIPLTPAPGAPPRSGSILGPEARGLDVGVVPMFWVIQRVSCTIR